MASFLFPTLPAGRRPVRRIVSYCLGGLMLAALAPVAAEAACVAAALNFRGEQIEGTRSVTRGVFPRVVCGRALGRCERRLDRIRAETGRPRPHARCEVVASGLHAAEVFGPPLEGEIARGGPRGDRYDHDRRPRAPLPGVPYPGERYSRDGDPRYDDRADRGGPADDLGPSGSHDGWRAAEDDPRDYGPRLDDPRLDDPRLADPRLADPRLADPLDDLQRGEDPQGGYRLDDDPRADRYGGRYPDDRYVGSCNYDACSDRYKTFRPSDCSYKPNLYERRRCPL